MAFRKRIFQFKYLVLKPFKGLIIGICFITLIACSAKPKHASPNLDKLNHNIFQKNEIIEKVPNYNENSLSPPIPESQISQEEIIKKIQNEQSLSFESAYAEKIEKKTLPAEKIDFKKLSKEELERNKDQFYLYLSEKYKNQKVEIYFVQKNDTLQKISFQLFKTTRYWTELYILNSKTLKKFDLLNIKEIYWYKNLDLL